MKTQVEQELLIKLKEKYGRLTRRVKLGESIRTFDDWGRAGYRILKGERAISVNVNGLRQSYFWFKQTWHVENYKAYKRREIEFSFDIEPSGRMNNAGYN